MKTRLQAFMILATMFAAALPAAAQTTAEKPKEIVLPVRIVDGPPKSIEDLAAEKASEKHEAADLVPSRAWPIRL